MNWKNRIVGYSNEPTTELKMSPKNWRTHPDEQAEALGGVLNEIGVVQNIIVNKRTGFVVDGHLRVKLALQTGQETVPVTWIDVPEAEEATLLAVLDPIGAMAGVDGEKLISLLDDVSTGEAAVQALLGELVEANQLYYKPAPEYELPKEREARAKAEREEQEDTMDDSPEEFTEYGDDIAVDHTCPSCGYSWSGAAQ